MDKISAISESMDEFQPDFILYNAGTDIMEGDPLGRLNITHAGVIMRDDYVFG